MSKRRSMKRVHKCRLILKWSIIDVLLMNTHINHDNNTSNLSSRICEQWVSPKPNFG